MTLFRLRRLTLSRRCSLLCSLLAVLLSPRPAGALSRIPLSLEETVQASDAIFVGRVLSRHSFWADERKKWMWTDVVLEVEDGISGARTGDSITVRYWGGQIGDEAMAVAGLRIPAPNERYVMLLKPKSGTARFSPVAGEVDGLFRVTGPVQQRTVINADGRPVALPGLSGGEMATGQPHHAAVTLADFTTWLRANIAPIRARPPANRRSGVPGPERIYAGQPVPAPDNAASTPANPTLPRSDGVDLTAPTAPVAAPDREPAVPITGGSSERGGVSTLYFRKPYTAALPIVFNQLPPAMAPWSGQDQAQMTKWNYYSDVYRVRATPTCDFAWSNGRYDMCGFPSSAVMQSQFGAPWEASTLGITYTRYNPSTNVILESDIALNPSVGWSLDEEWLHNGGGSAYSFRATVLHELGHAWGLAHQFFDYSVMNYVPRVYDPIVALPFMDDAEAIRAHYPDVLSNRIDVAVYLVSLGNPNAAGEYKSWTDSTFPNAVSAGNSFNVSDFRMENSGTIEREVVIEWYLSRNRNYDGDYRYLRTVNYGSLPRFYHFNPLTTNLTVPENIAEGTYYLGAYIRNDSGPTQGFFPRSNNEAFSRKTISVSQVISHVSPSNVTVKPGTNVIVWPYLKGPSNGARLTTFINGGSTAISVAPSVVIPVGSTNTAVLVHIAPRDLPTTATLFFSYGDDSKAVTFNIVPDFSMQDVRKALQTVAGFRSSSYLEREFWNIARTGASADRIGLDDVVEMLRRVIGASL